MKPYDGIEVWTYLVLAILAVVACATIFYAFKIEKVEKSTEDTSQSKKLRFKKYGFFAVFFLLFGAMAVVGFRAVPIAQDNFKAEITSYIESNDVKITEGFVNVSTPLKAGQSAKFVVDTKKGLIRCRANAPENGGDIQFLCQDVSNKELPFTKPLSEVNK